MNSFDKLKAKLAELFQLDQAENMPITVEHRFRVNSGPEELS